MTESLEKIELLPPHYKQALKTIEFAGGTVSDFMIDLVIDAENNGYNSQDIIEILKIHYTSNDQ